MPAATPPRVSDAGRGAKPPAAFVLLEHDQTAATALPPAERGVHWDFLLSRAPNQPLDAWRLAESPTGASGPIPAEPLPPHRRAYLEYEGPVSRGRGTVRQRDRGSAELLAWGEHRVRVRLRGVVLEGDFELAADGAGRWWWRGCAGGVAVGMAPTRP